MEEHGTHPETIKYMKKHKLGMWSAADKKLVKENTPPDYGKAKTEALKKRKAGLKKDYGGVHPLAEHKSMRRNIAKNH